MILSRYDRTSGVLRLRNGSTFRIRPGSTDRATINELFVLKPYAPNPQFEISECDRILDIGANIGAFTIGAARVAKRGMVFAVEPVAANFRLLEENVAMNGLRNVSLMRAAVGGCEAMVEIASEGSTASVLWTNNSHVEQVEQTTLTCLMQKLGTVDFLKMDCEGAEFSILLETQADVLRKIRRIALEYHNVSDGSNAETLKTRLKEVGFEVTQVGKEWTGMMFAINRSLPS